MIIPTVQGPGPTPDHLSTPPGRFGLSHLAAFQAGQG